MRGQKGFWRRPASRTYAYNLNVGEHYYSPMTSYLDAERGSRGEQPGALTYGERLARQWLHGRRYESDEVSSRYARASSASREYSASSAAASASASTSRSARASSCTPYSNMDLNNVSAFAGIEARKLTAADSVRTSRGRQIVAERMSQQDRQQIESSRRACAEESSSSKSVSFKKQVVQAQTEQRSARQEQQLSSSCQRSVGYIKDDICKKVADARMQPWNVGYDLDAAESASAKSRMRIADLERELDEITKRAMMTTTHACISAKAMSKAAMMEEDKMAASSYKKTKKVMIESSRKMSAA
jgi:hypothetical protein